MIDSIIQRISSLESELNGSTSNASSSFRSGNLLKNIKSIAKDLKETRQMCEGINAFLADAEMRQIVNESVRVWLHDLRRWTDDAGNLMDEYEYEYQRLSSHYPAELSSSYTIPLLLCDSFRREWATGVRELKNQFKDIAKRSNALLLTMAVGSRPFVDPFPDRSPCGSIPGDRTFLGRENELRQLKELLLVESSHDGNDIEVVAVIGMGGIGKTTLAQQVYKDPVITASFKRGWVSVAERFDVAHLLKAAIESFSRNASNLTEVSTLQDELKGRLVEVEKKVLLVLDDVWNENAEKWDNFIAPFIDGAPRGSKILLTTRLDDAARTSRVVNFIRPKGLSKDEGWSLLRKHAFGRARQNGNVNVSEEIEKMGKQIVGKCQGLPLAIKLLGGLLKSMGSDKEDSWKYVKESSLVELKHSQGGKSILGSLYLSYLHLQPQLKTCFRFCSIFCKLRPLEDRWELFYQNDSDAISILKLILMSFDVVKDERDAESCLQELKSRCFLELRDDLASNKDVSMHDLLHDLAEYVFKDRHLIIHGIPNAQNQGSSRLKSWHGSGIGKTYDIAEADNNQRNLRSLRFAVCYEIMSEASFDVGPKLQALFLEGFDQSYFMYPWIKTSDFVLCGKSFEDWKRLRMLSLGFSRMSISRVPPEIFQLYNLRYLKLTHSGITSLPDSLGNLRNLRWLNLSDNWRMDNLPESISRLVNLQELDVSGNYRMDSFPAGITNLTNLLWLSFHAESFSHVPAGFGNLRKLQYLPAFFVGSSTGQASIAELKNLVDLKDGITLENLHHVKSAANAKEAGMKDKKHIRKLQLYWSQYWRLRNGVLPLGLQEMEAEVSLGEQVIDCLRPHYNLEALDIKAYQGSKLPSWMGDDSFTKLVDILLANIPYCTSLSPIDQLPSLVKLTVFAMGMLSQVVSDHNDGSLPANTERRGPFPKLEEFYLSYCSELRFLSLHDFAAIRRVEVEGCDNLQGMDPPSNDVSSLRSVTIKYCLRFRYTPNPARPQTWELIRVPR